MHTPATDIGWTRKLNQSVAAPLVWRYATHAIMVGLTLLNEMRPGHQLRDWVIQSIPLNRWVLHHNYHLWALIYVPLALALWRKDRPAFIHFLWVGGVLSVLRGVAVLLVPLGPVEGFDVNSQATAAEFWQTWLHIVNPISALTTNVASISLTKDLFFSGHTSSTFLLWLYCRKHQWLGRVALVGHLVVVASVFSAHLHYTVDVVGAWVITYLVFKLSTSFADVAVRVRGTDRAQTY